MNDKKKRQGNYSRTKLVFPYFRIKESCVYCRTTNWKWVLNKYLFLFGLGQLIQSQVISSFCNNSEKYLIYIYFKSIQSVFVFYDCRKQPPWSKAVLFLRYWMLALCDFSSLHSCSSFILSHTFPECPLFSTHQSHSSYLVFPLPS